MFIGEPDALILARLIASAQGRHLPLRRAPLGSSTLSSVVPSFPAAVGGSSVGPLLPLLLGRHRGLCRHRCLPAPPYSLITLLLTTELLCHATAMGRRLWGRGWELECGARMMPALPRSKPAALAEWEEAGVDGTPAAAGLPLLDMPELVLDRVQEELSPASLTVMACLCTALKDWCFADVLLERHLRAKWGPLLGATAWEEWEGEEEEVTGHDPTLRLPVRRSQWTARAEHREAGSRDDRSTMKIAWGKNSKMKRQPVVVSTKPGLPFGVDSDTDEAEKEETAGANTNCPGTKPLDTAESLQRQGDKLAEEGKYHEALRRWEAALTLAPGNAILHEQKAQVLLEVGDAWHALTAATTNSKVQLSQQVRCDKRVFYCEQTNKRSVGVYLQATELDPLWPEAWVTLGRAQLNFGEPDSAILSFDKALAIKPDHDGARADRETAVRLVKKRGHLHSSGLSTNKRRFTVGENSVKGAEGEEKADETADSE